MTATSNADGTKVALFQETDAGRPSAHPLESFGSVDELHAWAREHDLPIVAVRDSPTTEP